MAYKDKDKQREAVKAATRRYRAKLKGITEGITEGITRQGITVIDEEPAVIPETDERTYANAVLCEPVSSGCRGCKLMSYQSSKGMSCPKGKYATAAVSVFEENVNPDHSCNGQGI